MIKSSSRSIILKITALSAGLLVIIAFVMQLLHKISNRLFWTIIVIAAIFAYKVLPALNKKE